MDPNFEGPMTDEICLALWNFSQCMVPLFVMHFLDYRRRLKCGATIYSTLHCGQVILWNVWMLVLYIFVFALSCYWEFSINCMLNGTLSVSDQWSIYFLYYFKLTASFSFLPTNSIMELERTLHFSKKKMQKLAKSLKLEDRQESEMKERREAFVHEDAKTKLNRLLLEQVCTLLCLLLKKCQKCM